MLRDRRGVYGTGVSKSFVDAARHRFEHEELEHEERLPDASFCGQTGWLITKPSGAVLQRITGEFRHGMFSRTAEERLRNAFIVRRFAGPGCVGRRAGHVLLIRHGGRMTRSSRHAIGKSITACDYSRCRSSIV